MKIPVATAVLLLALIMFTACNPANHRHEKAGAHDPEAAGMLTLNEGAKWKADSTTVRNVAALKNIAENANPSELGGYRETGKRLQEGIDKMVSDCKMKGAEHETLHHWLEPVMADTQRLSNAKDAVEANEILKSLKQQLSLFDNYFEP